MSKLCKVAAEDTMSPSETRRDRSRGGRLIFTDTESIKRSLTAFSSHGHSRNQTFSSIIPLCTMYTTLFINFSFWISTFWFLNLVEALSFMFTLMASSCGVKVQFLVPGWVSRLNCCELPIQSTQPSSRRGHNGHCDCGSKQGRGNRYCFLRTWFVRTVCKFIHKEIIDYGKEHDFLIICNLVIDKSWWISNVLNT